MISKLPLLQGTFDPDDETVQEIEKVKAQIAKMRRKKAEKALEQSKPFKIVRETNSNTKGPKTFTFVPNQQRKVVKITYTEVLKNVIKK